MTATRTTAAPPPPPDPPARPRAKLWAALAAAAAVLVVAVAAVAILASGGGRTQQPAPLPAVPAGRPGPESMFAAGPIAADTLPVLQTIRSLGVDRVHVYMQWDDIAPDPTSSRRPSFDATDPAAYPAAGWAPYDAVVRELAAMHMGINLALIPPPPNWASGQGAPDPATQPEWRPSAAEFGQFVHAVGIRYSGHYVPPGATAPLPRVNFWSIWNEPNLGIELAPEAVDHSRVEVAPRYYRAIVDAAWSAFAATGHRHDTILIGELAPAGGTAPGARPGNFNSMPPLRFLRALYCVNAYYQPLQGSAARVRGCPTTPAASARFAADHPGLFQASGFADHPYSQGLPPNKATPNEPDFTELAAVGHLEATLDRLQRVYGSDTRFPIWSTEFGYQTTPPDPEAGTVTPQLAAYYLNWAEYLTWLDPRLKSYDQYLLTDPPAGNFATGLLTAAGQPKPGWYAYRMPVFLPVTATRAGTALDVWGGARAAPDAEAATHRRQLIAIQFRPAAGGSFHTLTHVVAGRPHGYFELRLKFPGSGQVRLAWKPPHGPVQFSRVVAITLR